MKPDTTTRQADQKAKNSLGASLNELRNKWFAWFLIGFVIILGMGFGNLLMAGQEGVMAVRPSMILAGVDGMAMWMILFIAVVLWLNYKGKGWLWWAAASEWSDVLGDVLVGKHWYRIRKIKGVWICVETETAKVPQNETETVSSLPEKTFLGVLRHSGYGMFIEPEAKVILVVKSHYESVEDIKGFGLSPHFIIIANTVQVQGGDVAMLIPTLGVTENPEAEAYNYVKERLKRYRKAGQLFRKLGLRPVLPNPRCTHLVLSDEGRCRRGGERKRRGVGDDPE